MYNHVFSIEIQFKNYNQLGIVWTDENEPAVRFEESETGVL